MIRITEREHSITVLGHAQHAPPGQEDIVCEAVGTLVQTLAASLELLTDDEIKYEIAAGKAFITYKDPTEQAQLLIRSFFVGVSGLAELYPENVSVKSRQGSL